VRLLGGEIKLTSEVGKGSAFTVYMPQRFSAAILPNRAQERPHLENRIAEPPASPHFKTAVASTAELRSELRAYTQEFDDDRNSTREGDQTIMMIENDLTFAALLIEVVRNRGFKGVIATRGSHALSLAKELKPVAITLDILLPDCSGFTVLERLKRDKSTSYIPVHVISIAEERNRALGLGAASFTQKTSGAAALANIVDRIRQGVQTTDHDVLVVSSDENQQREMVEIIGNGVVHSTVVSSIADAVGASAMKSFECVIASPTLLDGTVADLIERTQVLQRDGWLRVITYSSDPIPAAINGRLQVLGASSVIRNACSPSELLELAAIFLHRNESQLSETKQQMLAQVRQNDPKLAGKRILMVDDDARNIFAITSALERAQIEVVYAENGRAGIERLQDTPGIDLVLMDVMMPEMDGYAATRAIRAIDRFRGLPIIAVTAKAMIGDREKCIQAGASDYIPKPVDMDQLFSLLRVWLPDHKSAAIAASNRS
jgi:CheY-like chemotaxis protein